ncbi:MAG: prepilin-type N-terminal cleavage/methylation domain-containing protein [Candidatus Omnitrophica bacterium]|nr:prepilin-type N-terminal cleavage/methylation domain-containing protein [Candidatus Omnitrophota bacterium]
MKKSFTLIELLIVVIIVGILATVALPQYTKVVEKARWTEAVSMLGTMRKAAIIYYNEHGYYPNPTVGHGCLNGPAAAIDYGLLIDIPDDIRFIYALHSHSINAIWCGLVYKESDAMPGGHHDGSKPYMQFAYDGTLESLNGAPEF